MPVPANRIMGKSADYVTNYTQCYQEQTKSDNGMAAIWGCVTEVGIVVIIWVIELATVATVVASTPY
jgi:hypothetical protein